MRQKENDAMFKAVHAAGKCKDFACTMVTEKAVKTLRAKIRDAREARSLKCMAKVPGVAVARTQDAPSNYGVSKRGGRKQKQQQHASATLVSESTMCCVVRDEGLCVDFSPDLSLAEARTACRLLCDSYDFNVEQAFFQHKKCSRRGAVGYCEGAVSMKEQGDVTFFAPMDAEEARQHCRQVGGRYFSGFGHKKQQGDAGVLKTAEDVAALEAEGYKAFAALLEGAVERNGTVVRNVDAGGRALRSASSSSSPAPSWGSPHLQVVVAVCLLVFVVLAAGLATMLYVKTSVEGQHRRRRVGEGYVKVNEASVPLTQDVEKI